MTSEYNDLKRWLNINDNLEMVGTTNRSIVAKRGINNGDIIMSIPNDKLIDDDKINDINLKTFYNRVRSKNSILAVNLLNNENNINLKPYYNISPKDISNFFYYSVNDKLKDLLKSSNLGKELNSHMAYLQNDANVLKDFIKGREEDYFKYRLLVGSRVFSYSKKGKRYSGLVPYADMLNHSSNPNCKWYYNDSTNCFEVKATRDIQQGGEILDSYGNKSNIQYYLYYGFILPNNWNTSIYVDGYNVYLNNDLEYIKNKIKKKNNIDDISAEKRLFPKLYEGLKRLPTKTQLIENGADRNVIKIVNKDKEIYKKLLSPYLDK